jgi:hypothetical protein
MDIVFCMPDKKISGDQKPPEKRGDSTKPNK